MLGISAWHSLCIIKCCCVWALRFLSHSPGVPEKPEIDGLRKPALEGDHITLTCITQGSKPAADLRWFRNEKEVKGIQHFLPALSSYHAEHCSSSSDALCPYWIRNMSEVLSCHRTNSISEVSKSQLWWMIKLFWKELSTHRISYIILYTIMLAECFLRKLGLGKRLSMSLPLTLSSGYLSWHTFCWTGVLRAKT